MNRSVKKFKAHGIDKKFLWITGILLLVGVTTFLSASLSIYTENTELFYAMLIRHLGFGVVGGIAIMILFSKLHFSIWKKFSTYIYIIGIILTFLVFSPLGFSHGGAQRWISLGFISFQPAELLKFAVIVFLSAWFAQYHDRIKEWKYGFWAFGIIVGLAVLPLMLQPDSGSFLLIGLVSFILYWLRGASWKHVIVIMLAATGALSVYAAFNPHVVDRLQTFTNPNSDPYGASYQIRQSRIAIGSGMFFGRGLGQSVHKFGSYLPESNSDSIFAVYAEEFGYLGSFLLIVLYSVFTFFGLRIARRAPTTFSQNLAAGIILLISVQVFFNIAAISGLVPLSGLPLIFMSSGGTALIVTLAQIGIVLNISKYTVIKKNR
ncbi:hypothetical protein CL684_02700 [Candidatus Campbellbacteria bacterium]|nr:hypothetical protein [Candidatus Campbellbacteria bacterium]